MTRALTTLIVQAMQAKRGCSQDFLALLMDKIPTDNCDEGFLYFIHSRTLAPLQPNATPTRHCATSN